jgi:hypothetical protein
VTITVADSIFTKHPFFSPDRLANDNANAAGFKKIGITYFCISPLRMRSLEPDLSAIRENALEHGQRDMAQA